jgi:Mn-dependent DtxR family transcriptional regulator
VDYDRDFRIAALVDFVCPYGSYQLKESGKNLPQRSKRTSHRICRNFQAMSGKKWM